MADNEPYHGYMRDRYSTEEMKDLDEFCTFFGIEVIPCIQTFAHFTTHKIWGKVPFDHIREMMVGDE